MNTAVRRHKCDIQQGEAKPPRVAIIVDGIPEEIRQRQQFCCWRWVKKDGKWTKPPTNPLTECGAKSNDPTTWATLFEALAYYAEGKADGVGYFLNGETGIDLDDCRNPDTGEIDDWAQELIGKFATYAEISPSDTGIKLLAKGKVPGRGRKRDPIEMYDSVRYFTLTGRRLPTAPATINNCQPQIDALHRENWPEEYNGHAKTESAKPAGGSSHATDDEIIDKGKKLLHNFAAAWAGDKAPWNGDDSAADMALCNLLAWLVGPDAARIDRLFRQSGLYRDKWDGKRPGGTYGSRTIAKALAGRTQYCDDAGGSSNKQASQQPGEDSGAPPAPKYRVNLIDSATFAKTEYKREYLIQFVVVKDQPGTWAGPIKSMKTSTLVDAAVSIATGTPFLGEFHIPQRRRVAVLSGESGEPTLQEIGRRVCKARGLELGDLKDWLYWGFDLPQLSDPDHVAALQQTLKDHAIEVLEYDPLYLGLLGANPDGISAANLYQTGPLLMSVGKACLEVGCTPLLAHHFKLTRKETYAEPQLDDLAYSGIREFVRQWVLLSRRSPYDPVDPEGLHEIWLSAGGSAGHSALRAINVREGKLKEDFTGRYWQVEVITPSDARTANSGAKTAEKGRREEAQDKDDEVQILNALDKMDPDREGVSFRKLRVQAKVPRERAERACERLCGEDVLEGLTVVTVGGNGAKLKAEGYRRPRRSDP
jgi:replicative DNA helicase